VDFFVRDYVDAPTQYGRVSLNLSPARKFHSNLGYRVSSVTGNRFFNDARDVAGSLVSTYQSPFANVSWKLSPKMTWKAEYNYYGYGEGEPSGAQYCSTTVSVTATVVPCASFSYPTGMTESVFRADPSTQLPRQQRNARSALRVLISGSRKRNDQGGD
jgi:hypothetical protein